MGNISVTDIDFVDDIAILFESIETRLVVFSLAAKPLGLEVYWTKTMIQSFGKSPLKEYGLLVHACNEDF